MPFISWKDSYPAQATAEALKHMGDYVYGYYRPGEYHPFYVGKGMGTRVLDHWKNARSGKRLQEQAIREIFRTASGGKSAEPTIKLLAYNLEKVKSKDVYSVAERVLQDAFGIQKVYEKKPAVARLVQRGKGVLLQVREDSRKSPTLTLDSVLAKAAVRPSIIPQDISDRFDKPVLLVGLSKTFHASYSQDDLSEMARKYWNLKTKSIHAQKLDALQRNEGILLAWSSALSGVPTIVGVWGIRKGSVQKAQGTTRFEMAIHSDREARLFSIGRPLVGKGQQYQGPRLYVPD